jgi:hypothetical protein
MELSVVVHTLIPALGRLRQKDQEFKASLGFIAKQLSQKSKTKKKPNDPVSFLSPQ